MDEAVLRLRVGLFVLIALVILGILIFLNSEGWKSQYTIYVKPSKAPGVTINTPIRKNGILIGRVSDVKTIDGGVLLQLKIDQDELIYENEICSIGTESFLGDAVVEILAPQEGKERGNQVSADFTMTEVAVKRNPLEIIDTVHDIQGQLSDTLAVVQDAGKSVKKAGDGIESITKVVGDALGDETSELKQLITKFNAATEQVAGAAKGFETFLTSANKFMEDPENEANFKATVKEIPELARKLSETIDEAKVTIKSYKDISKSITTNFENIEPFTKSLKTNGPGIVEKINNSFVKIDKLISDISGFTENFGDFGGNIGEALKDPNSSINRLLKDKEMFDQFRQAVANIKKLSDQLEPIARDARMFVDSIARDPSQLGLKGAIENRTPGAGYKGTAGRNRGFRK